MAGFCPDTVARLPEEVTYLKDNTLVMNHMNQTMMSNYGDIKTRLPCPPTAVTRHTREKTLKELWKYPGKTI